MKKQLLIAALLMGTLLAGRSAVYYQGTAPVGGGTSMGALSSTTIYDGNPAYVIGNSMTLSGLGSSLSGLTVTLNISGGNNSGLYAYLVHGGTTVTLMNQPGVGVNGFGAYGAGMNLTLQDAGAANGPIQSAISGSVLTGSYSAAGSLASFNNGDPNGLWTLYFADTIPGGGNATLNGWSLNITAVPEPVNVALGVFGGLLVVGGFVRNRVMAGKVFSFRK